MAMHTEYIVHALNLHVIPLVLLTGRYLIVTMWCSGTHTCDAGILIMLETREY